MPRLAAPLAITTVAITAVAAAASAALLLWTVRRTRGRDASAAASEASLPAGTASARERSRRLQRFGNDLPEADVPSLPLIGHARALAEVHAIFARIGTAFNFSFFSIDVLAVAGHENLRRVFSNMESFNSAYPARWLELFGPSAVTFIEKEHRRIRNILNAGISKTSMLECYARIHELAKEQMDAIALAGRPKTDRNWLPWSERKETKGAQVIEYAHRFTFHVMSVFIAGADPAHEAQLTKCRHDIETFADAMADLVFPRFWPYTPFNKAMRARARVVKVVLGMVENRRARMEAGESFRDLLGNLMEYRRSDGDTLADNEICDNVIVMLFAGYDTTSATLSTATYFLTHVLSPSERTNLQAEIDGLPLVGGLPSEDALQSLPLLDAFMKETLRIMPPGKFVFRKAAKDAEINGSPVRSGTVILAHLQTTMLDEMVFPHPDTFDLARFLPGGSALAAPSFAYIPFGGGPRLCLGMQLAKLKFKVFLFQMLRFHTVEAGTAPPVHESFPVQRTLNSVYLTTRKV